MTPLTTDHLPPDADVPWWDIRRYDYHLPQECIAQQPAARRDASRLLVYDRRSETIEHAVFRDLPRFVNPGDALVVNTCRVIPARLFMRRADTGTEIELLLTRCLSDAIWEAMVKPGRSCKINCILRLPGGAAGGDAIVRGINSDGQRVIEFFCGGDAVQTLLRRHGVMPLPPYIHRSRTASARRDATRYQTVYARGGAAIAAPTAGLHFTAGLLTRIKQRQCQVLSVALDVGVGTFQPVKCADIRQHAMHSEQCAITPAVAAALNATRAAGGAVIAVGTTSLRVLEQCLDAQGVYQPYRGATAIFIHPPERVRSVDALITNFHLPKSTLLMLVDAWIGTPARRRVYAEALTQGYRFYSYGDAMLLR